MTKIIYLIIDAKIYNEQGNIDPAIDLRYFIPWSESLPALCMSTTFIFSNLALQYTAATNMSFLRSLSALIAPILAFIVFRDSIKKGEWIVMICMLLGLYLLCAKGGLHGFGLGEVLALIAATLVAGSLVFGKSALDSVSAKTLSFMQTFQAIFFCAMMTFISGSFSEMIYVARTDIILSLLYAAVGCTIIGYMLQNMALKHISSKQVAIIQCLYPIATAVIAYIILKESLSIAGIIGATIIISCVCIENMIKN